MTILARAVGALAVTGLTITSHYWIAAALKWPSPSINWMVAPLMWGVMFGLFSAVCAIPAKYLD